MKLPVTIFGIFTCLIAYAEAEFDYTFIETRNMTDISHSNAIPSLVEYLQIEGGNIRKYAAAQSLFLMNTPETRTALEDNLFSTPYFDFQQSIKYAFYWHMLNPDKRNEFIQKYHLRSTSDQLALKIKVCVPTNNPGRVEITLAIKNTTEHPLRLYKPTEFGSYILLISSAGEVARPEATMMPFMRDRPPEEMYIEVPSGELFEISFTGELKLLPLPSEYTASFSRTPQDTLVLEVGSYIHVLAHEGSFRVFGQYSYPPRKDLPFDNIWTGRIVSEPVEIQLRQLTE